MESLPGRGQLGPNDLEAIRNLPGEKYLFDLESAEVDLRFHYKFSPHYFSREQADLHELLATKYQLTIGFYHRVAAAFSPLR